MTALAVNVLRHLHRRFIAAPRDLDHPNPTATLAAFVAHLAPSGQHLPSYFRSGNDQALWRRLTARVPIARTEIVADEHGQVWNIRALRPTAEPAHDLRSPA